MVYSVLKEVFLLAYLLFVAWSLLRWARLRIFRDTSFRSRIGSGGLLAASSSAVLLFYFYCYVLIARALTADGLALWTWAIVGEAFAVAGLILALFGTGWVRQSGFLISLVAFFQWGRPSVGIGPMSKVDAAMFASIAFFGCVLFASRYFHSRRPAQ
jgi:hypothetical protein